MGKILKFGCLGIIGLVVLLVIVAIAVPRPSQQQTVSGQPAAKPGAPAELPSVGQTASRGGWEVTLNDFGSYDKFASRPPSTAAQGRLVVVDFTAKNTQNRT